MTGEITTCGDRKPIPVAARGKHLVVDIHCHLGIPAADAIVQAKYPGPPPGINDFTSAKTMEVNRAQFAAIGRTLNTLDTRLADMDRLGIDVQAISPSPGQYFYFTDAETGREAARAVNDGMAEAVAKHPGRLVGMGTVPLQNTEMAVAEMKPPFPRSALAVRLSTISGLAAGPRLSTEALGPLARFWGRF